MKEKWRCQENDLQARTFTREVLCDACFCDGEAHRRLSERVAASTLSAKGEHAAGRGANQLLIPDKSCIYSRRVVLEMARR